MKLAKHFPFLLAIAVSALAGCTVGPNYKRPTAPVVAKWDIVEPWRESTPQDTLPKGQWWNVFNDEDLNTLEKQSIDANQFPTIGEFFRITLLQIVGCESNH